ncbi:MAG: hypothetical protein PHO27_10930 [Sulfuricurvum sp.]|nr:hypothetical protein [Sulfuricurvum sp.]
MLKMKSLVLLAAIGVVFMGCGAKQVQLPLEDTIGKSYEITKGMDQATVSSLLPMKPTSMQRINNEEIWKYEGNVVNPGAKEGTYHNLIIKFVDGKMEHIGTFSCKLPYISEK